MYGVSAVGTNVYAATSNGLSVSTNGGTSFINKTTADGLGSNTVNGVSAVGNIVFAATSNGLSISIDGGTSFINKTTANSPGLYSNVVNGVYTVGSFNNSVIDFFVATSGGLNYSYCLDCISYSDFIQPYFLATTRDGLGSNIVNGVSYGLGGFWAATANGLSFSFDGVRRWSNSTTADGLGSNSVRGVYANSDTVYAATSGGLSVFTGDGTPFINYTTADGLGSNDVRSVYALGGSLFVGTTNGLNVSTNSTLPFTRYTNLTGAPLGSTQAYDVSALYADGSTVYAVWAGGLSIGT